VPSTHEELEALLHCSVDLVPKHGRNWVIKDRVLDEAKILYLA